MKNISAVSDRKDIVTVEYLDDVTAVADKSSNFTINGTVHYPLLALTAYGRSWQGERIVNNADAGINGYGLPVSANGNYTDANGQEWVCDELVVNADGTGKIKKRTLHISSSDSSFTVISRSESIYSLSFATEQALQNTKGFCSATNIYLFSTAAIVHYYFYETEALVFLPVDYDYSAKPVTMVGILKETVETDLTSEQLTALQPLVDKYGAFTAYFMSTQDGAPIPENPVEIVSTTDLHRVSVPIESIGDSGSLTVTTQDGTAINISDIGINGYGIRAAKGNYTDANGQQWICDKLIVNADGTGKIVRRTHKESINISDFNKVANVNTTLYSYESMMYSTSYVVEKLLSVSNTYRYNTIDNPHYYAEQRNLRIYVSNDKVGAFESNESIIIVYDITNPYETELTAEQIAALQPVIDRYGAFTAYFMSTQDGTPTPENPVEIVSTADLYQFATVTITTALPLCGIPVSDGGNYTDGNGQEWVCDTIEYNYTSAVKKQRTAVLDSYNGETVGDNYISTTGGLDTGATVIYPAENAIETPLTADEINQLRNLETFDGITNVYNNGKADMSVEYMASKAVSKAVMPIITVLRGDSNA